MVRGCDARDAAIHSWRFHQKSRRCALHRFCSECVESGEDKGKYYIDRIIGHGIKEGKTKYHVLWVPVGDQEYGDKSWEFLDEVRHTQAFLDYKRQRRMSRGVHVDISECEWPAAVEQMLKSAGVNVHELDQGTQDCFAQARFCTRSSLLRPALTVRPC